MIRQILFICLFVAVLVFVDSYLTLIIGMVMCSLISYCGTKIVVGNWEKMSVYSFVSDTVPNLNETDSNSSLGYSEINDSGQRGDLIEGTYCTRSPSLFIEREELIQESAEMKTDQNERAFNLSHCGTKLSHTEEIRTFSKIIFSHYIQTWYKNISQNEDTSEEFSDILNDILETALKNLSRICILDVVEKLIHLYNQHFHHYLQAIDIVKQRHDFVSVKDCIGMETEIHSAYKMSHPALADEPTEWCYLRSISATIIDLLCPQEFLCCNAPYAMLEEILSKNVLSSLVDLFSNPDWLNQMIVVLLSDSTIVTQRFCDAKHFEENICNGKVSNYKNSEKLKVTSAVASTSKQNEHSVYSEVPLHTHLQSVDKQVCPSTRRHSDCEDKNHQHLLRLSLDKRHFPSSTDIYIDYQDISQPSDEIVISYEQHSPETDWESWSNEISVKKETLEISYYSNLSKIKSQSSQDIDNFSLIESEHDCEENEESQEKELKKCQSDDCLSEQSPLPHLVSVNSTNLYLDANNSRASKIADTSFPKKENIGVDEEAEEATEVAWLDLFSDLKIVETEIQEEIGKGTYLLYCIQYSALFCNKEMSPMQYVKSNVLVKRRFREFLALQSRLEDNPKLKKYIKKIKAPNKSIGSFFSPLDKKIVDERKQFLERYLQQLCSYKLIAASSELQEFLAYGSDARIAYVRKPSDIGVPRIDKIFIKGVKGALDMIKTALPGIPQDDSEKNSTIITKGMQGKTSFLPVFGKSKQENYQHPMEVKYIGYNDSYLTQQLTDHIEHFDMHSSEGSIDVRNELPHRKIFRSDSGSSVDVSFILQQEDTSKSAITDQAKFQRPFKMEMPLANAVLDLYLKSIKIFLPYLGNTIITRVLKASFGYYFNRWLAKRILLLFSHEKCVNYLHILHLSLWPEGEETSHKIEKMENPEDSKLHKDAAFIALKLFLPGILNKLLGKTAFEDSLLLFHDSIQYSKLNRCLVYHVLDQLMDHLCAEEKI